MITVKSIYDRENDMAKKDQSGYNTPAEFNNRLAQVQVELLEYLYPFIEVSQVASDLLSPFIKATTLVTNAQGAVAEPVDCMHSLSYSYQVTSGPPATYIPMKYLSANQADDIARNPNRNTNVPAGRVGYTYENNLTISQTLAVSTLRLRYLATPPASSIAFTQQFQNGQYFLQYDGTNTVDLVWDPIAFNLLLYLMLEKLGVEIREQFLVEFSSTIGIQRNKIKRIR